MEAKAVITLSVLNGMREQTRENRGSSLVDDIILL
jgi:hypothetical protein